MKISIKFRKKIYSGFFLLSVVMFLIASGCRKDENPSPEIPPNTIDLDLFSAKLKGFNLQGKFDVFWSNNGFSEEDFIVLSDLGFNFVRLPLDYLAYTEWGDWNRILENEVTEIDQAVEWGEKYNVHVCINLHRAPGYSVNKSGPIPANQQVDLWTSKSTQDAFVSHWNYFASRYKDVPAEELSFNLLNEPDETDEVNYVNIMSAAIDKIHSHNPNRVIFVDGLQYGNELIMSLKNARNIIQAIHAYEPFTLTHYKASWVEGSDGWPIPFWPMIDISNYLYGPWKPEYQSSLGIEGEFTEDSKVIVNIRQVSIESTLEIRLDEEVVLSKSFVCGPDPGEDWTEIIQTQWGYQNISNKDYSVTLPANDSRLTISNAGGDWMTYNRIIIQSGSGETTIIPGDNSWGSEQETIHIDADGKITNEDGKSLILSNLYRKLETARNEDIPVMIQEFGVHNQTPHDVTLAFLSDLVLIFNEFDAGYALWNLEGSFGILNSDRGDCNYESYQGELLDRDMLDILKSSGF
ncbi:MAG: cellulase family glycosylhydrolase [Cyclobacteriaceae bacterium]|nr:cellulase family glycosylhydrolase [Cyclobacteriaceae bacterium]